MPTISMRQLLEAGVHFGHQTRRWNPKMKPYIFAERNGIHIIDLAQTARLLGDALDFVTETVASGDYVLFVGTKKQAQEPIQEQATRAEMPYVNHRWLGGMLTNFVTIRKRVGLLDQLEARQASGDLDRLSKKEASRLTDEMHRLQLKLGGVRKMRRLPGAIFVVDPVREKIAVTEARRLEIPVIATGDTNVDPDSIDYIIPANDDAIRSIRLLCTMVADAAIEGMGQRAARAESEPAMGADVSDAETASDEMIAAVAAGGTYSFAPEPDEDEAVLPGEEAAAADAPAAGSEAETAEAPAVETPAAAAAEADKPAAPPEAAPAAETAEAAAAEAAPAAEAPEAAPAAEDDKPAEAPEAAPAAEDDKPAEASARAEA
ncbi:MAG: 30S ribosomal protein S2 [Chloroflexota bacterium]|jgi:small subunit ribosomal protein S2